MAAEVAVASSRGLLENDGEEEDVGILSVGRGEGVTARSTLVVMSVGP